MPICLIIKFDVSDVGDMGRRIARLILDNKRYKTIFWNPSDRIPEEHYAFLLNFFYWIRRIKCLILDHDKSGRICSISISQ